MFIESLSFSFHGHFIQDYVSFGLICLTGWVVMFCLISRVSEEWDKNSMRVFFLYIGIMIAFLLVRFSSLSFLVFYVSFEFVFVLMFIFVLGWGYRTERLQASFYMIFYTLVVSFPFLVYLIGCGYLSGRFWIMSE